MLIRMLCATSHLMLSVVSCILPRILMPYNIYLSIWYWCCCLPSAHQLDRFEIYMCRIFFVFLLLSNSRLLFLFYFFCLLFSLYFFLRHLVIISITECALSVQSNKSRLCTASHSDNVIANNNKKKTKLSRNRNVKTEYTRGIKLKEILGSVEFGTLIGNGEIYRCRLYL